MKLSVIIIILCLLSCIKSTPDDFHEKCPVTLQYGPHVLKVPVTISPHKLTYKVGDTIFIRTIFSDSIYDYSAELTYKIPNFPFKPQSLLFRMTSDTSWESGYVVNELAIDPKYKPGYVGGEFFIAETIFSDGMYMFEARLVLRKPGRYIFAMSDLYNDNDSEFRKHLNAVANAIQFEGRCPYVNF